MALFEQFPYTNFHELNLDWLLQQVKRQGSVIDSIVADGNTSVLVISITQSGGSYSCDVAAADIRAALNSGIKVIACIKASSKKQTLCSEIMPMLDGRVTIIEQHIEAIADNTDAVAWVRSIYIVGLDGSLTVTTATTNLAVYEEV